MTPEQEVREAVSAAVEREGEWQTFRSWKAKAEPGVFTVEHPLGQGDVVHAAVGKVRSEVGRTETSRTYMRLTSDEVMAAIMRILGGPP
jgi:hypothetical protein